RLAAARVVPDRDGHESLAGQTMASRSAFVQRIGIGRVDDLAGELIGEARARHRGEVACLLLLAILRAKGTEPTPSGESHGSLNFALGGIGAEFIVERGQGAVDV